MITFRIQVNTLSFNFIVLSSIAIFMSLATALFSEIGVEYYNIYTSFRTMMDGMIGSYFNGMQPARNELY